MFFNIKIREMIYITKKPGSTFLRSEENEDGKF